MKLLKKMKENQQPFAIMQYNEWLLGMEQYCNRRYEVLFIKDNKLKTKKLDRINPDEFEGLTKVLSNRHGSIHEFLNFKEHMKEVQTAYNDKFDNLIDRCERSFGDSRLLKRAVNLRASRDSYNKVFKPW